MTHRLLGWQHNWDGAMQMNMSHDDGDDVNDDNDDDDKDLVSCLPHELLCLLSPNGRHCYHPTNFVSHHLVKCYEIAAASGKHIEEESDVQL